MEKIARETLPPEFTFDWGGASYQEKRSGGTSLIALQAYAAMTTSASRGAVRDLSQLRRH